MVLAGLGVCGVVLVRRILQSSGEPLASVIRMVSDALMRYGMETDHRAVVARCDQPAPYRDLITGETGGLSSDYRDAFAAANRVLDGQPIQQTRDDLRASLDTTDEIDTEGIELQPELAAKAIVSAMVHWPTDVPRKLSAQVAAMTVATSYTETPCCAPPPTTLAPPPQCSPNLPAPCAVPTAQTCSPSQQPATTSAETA